MFNISVVEDTYDKHEPRLSSIKAYNFLNKKNCKNNCKFSTHFTGAPRTNHLKGRARAGGAVAGFIENSESSDAPARLYRIKAETQAIRFLQKPFCRVGHYLTYPRYRRATLRAVPAFSPYLNSQIFNNTPMCRVAVFSKLPTGRESCLLIFFLIFFLSYPTLVISTIVI